MFNKVLVANRGEIAARIVEVLRENDIASVAIYSEADANAPHVRLADEAVCIGPPPAAELPQPDAILRRAITRRRSHHPGYGLRQRTLVLPDDVMSLAFDLSDQPQT